MIPSGECHRRLQAGPAAWPRVSLGLQAQLFWLRALYALGWALAGVQTGEAGALVTPGPVVV